MSLNPIQLVASALTLGEDAIKLYRDLGAHDKPDAVAACLDALPVLASVFNKPLSDLQAVITADGLGVAYDLEQDTVRVLPLIEAALAKYHASVAA
jgi:hypothetical protein